MRFTIPTTCGAFVGLIIGSIGAHYMQSPARLEAGNKGATPTVSQNCLSCHVSTPRYRRVLKHNSVRLQVFTAEFADSILRPVNPPVVIGDTRYTVELDEFGGSLIGRRTGGGVKYSIQYVFGGKQIYYFLTTRKDGDLRFLPLAFDRRTRCWLSTSRDRSVPQLGSTAQECSSSAGVLGSRTACEECHDVCAPHLQLRANRKEIREAAVKY